MEHSTTYEQVHEAPRRGSERWRRIRQRLGGIARWRHGLGQEHSAPNGTGTSSEDHQDDPDAQQEAERLRRQANQALFDRRVPEPYILGSQEYTDPSIWLPEGVTDIINDEQYKVGS